MLFVGSLALSRASVAYFLLRLTPVGKHRRLISGLLGFVAIWGLVLLFAIALTCDLSSPWIVVGQRCIGYVGSPTMESSDKTVALTGEQFQYTRWLALEAMGCVLEAALFLTVVWLVWDVHTRRGNKAAVVTAFGFRLL